jgi:hypothetical protein
VQPAAVIDAQVVARHTDQIVVEPLKARLVSSFRRVHEAVARVARGRHGGVARQRTRLVIDNPL